MNGIVYVAHGKKQYINEAIRSAQSTGIQSCLITDTLGDYPIFTYQRWVEPLQMPALLNKVYMLATASLPFDNVLFLDTDTVAVAEIGHLFELLDNFDVACCHAPHRISYPYVRLNTGVILFRRDCGLLDMWLKRALEMNVNDDQPAFTEVVYQSDLRLFVMPPEYNLRVANIVPVNGKAFILHGRHDRLESAIKSINQSTAARIWNGRKQQVSEL